MSPFFFFSCRHLCFLRVRARGAWPHIPAWTVTPLPIPPYLPCVVSSPSPTPLQFVHLDFFFPISLCAFYLNRTRGHHRWPDLPHPSPLCLCKHKRLALCLSTPVSLLLPSRPHQPTSERARGRRDGIHHDRLFMLTTGLRITPLRNEDRYAPAFLLAALQFFLLPLCQLLLFLIFSFSLVCSCY